MQRSGWRVLTERRWTWKQKSATSRKLAGLIRTNTSHYSLYFTYSTFCLSCLLSLSVLSRQNTIAIVSALFWTIFVLFISLNVKAILIGFFFFNSFYTYFNVIYIKGLHSLCFYQSLLKAGVSLSSSGQADYAYWKCMNSHSTLAHILGFSCFNLKQQCWYRGPRQSVMFHPTRWCPLVWTRSKQD